MIQVNDQLNNSKTRLEDCLTEMSRKTVSNFENSADDSTAALDAVELKLVTSQSEIKNMLVHLDHFAAKKFQANKFAFLAKLKKTDDLNLMHYHNIVAKLNAMLELDLTNIAANTNTIQLDTRQEFKNVKDALDTVVKMMIRFQNDLDSVSEVILAGTFITWGYAHFYTHLLPVQWLAFEKKIFFDVLIKIISQSC